MFFVVACFRLPQVDASNGNHDGIHILPYEISAEDLITDFMIPKKMLIVQNASKSWPLYKMLHNSKKLEAIKDVKINTSMLHHSNYAPLESTFGSFVKKDLHGTSFQYNVLSGDAAISRSLRLPWMISSCKHFQDEFANIGDVDLYGSKTKRKSYSSLNCNSVYSISAVLSGRMTIRKMGDKTPYELVRGDMLFVPKGVCFNPLNVGVYVTATFTWNWEGDDVLKEMAKNCRRPSLLSVTGQTDTFSTDVQKTIKKIPDVQLSSGYMMPPIGLGTSRLFTKTYETVKAALKMGYRMIDTAQVYSGDEEMLNFKVSSEEEVGRAIADSGVPRSEIFLVTKLNPDKMERENAIKEVEKSLKNLKTDYVDLLLIHDFYMARACGPDEEHLPECQANPFLAWKTLEELQAKGVAKSIGVSNIYVDDLRDLIKFAQTPISVVQNWFDPLHQEIEIREICKENNIRFMGYSALGFFWIDKTQGMGLEKNPVLKHEVIIEGSTSQDLPVASVVLRWAMERNVTVMPCTTNVDHLEQNLNSRLYPIPDRVLTAIDKLDNEMGNPDEEEVQENNNGNSKDEL
uniref:NADP-dependent oxidoreductase domain-containing protein n=1 Tax=Ciona savignyi TaxID=51511 RepID=H2ZBH9_CIOSA